MSDISTLPNTGSTRTERRKLKKIKHNLPKTPLKRAKIVEKLAQSPTCSNILQIRGILNILVARRISLSKELETLITETVTELKSTSGGVSGQGKEAALAGGIKQIVNRIKGRYACMD